MPVTARLSQRFYETLGEDVAKELVDWFNDVDASYRADLREFNELNFARFDAKVEQRFAESDARLEKRFAQAEVKLEQRLAQVDAKMEQRFGQVDAKMEQRFAQVDAKMEQRFAQVDVKLQSLKSELIKWMFLFWTGSALTNLLIRR